MITHATAASAPTAATVNAYELLRDHCLNPQAALNGELGLTVLLRHGMLAWTRAWSTCQQSLPTRRPDTVDDVVSRSATPRTSLVDVLVAMVSSAARLEQKAGTNR